MIKRYALALAAAIVALAMFGEEGAERLVLNVSAAGTIAEEYAEQLNGNAGLKVIGPIGDADINAMRLATIHGELRHIDLSDAVLENGIIPDHAFFNNNDQYQGDGQYRLSRIKSIIFPENTKEIGSAAFARCPGLEDVGLPKSLRKIGISCFAYCGKLATSPLVIPEGVTEIPQLCFRDSYSLREVVLPSTIKTIGDFAFSMSGVTVCELPSGLESIRQCAFAGADLRSITIPDKCLTFVGGSHFIDNRNAISLHIPEGVSEIPYDFASQCENLTELTLPSTVEVIGENAFSFCSSLRTITLPEGLKRIESMALWGISLNDITFPSTLEYLGKNSCSSWKNVKSISSRTVVPPVCDGEVFSYSYGVTLYVPTGSAEVYRAAPGWEIFGQSGSAIVESDELSPVGIETTEIGEIIINISVDAGAILINASEPSLTGYSVYAPDGRQIASGSLSESTKRLPVTPGIYIVRAGSTTKKVSVG